MEGMETIAALSDTLPEEMVTVLEMAPIGIVVLRGRELVYEYVNRAFQAFAPTVPLIGRPFAEASWEMPEVLERLQEVWATGRPWHGTDLTVSIERAPGGPIEQASFTFNCVKMTRRTPPDALLGFVLDTTERVRSQRDAEQALRESRLHGAKLMGIIDTMLEGVIVFDTDRKIQLINEAARKMLADLGVEPALLEHGEDVVQRLDGHVPGQPAILVSELPVNRALKGKTSRSTLRFWNPSSQRYSYASIGATPIRDREGRVVGAVGVGSDVTEMTELDRLKDEFIRVIAHELKTPITIMKGYAATLAEALGPSLTPALGRMLQAIGRGADRIDRIMCELLDAQQIELGCFELVEERVELLELLQEVVDRAALGAPKHQVRVTRSEPVVVIADRERLREVLRILLDNAVRYSPAGGDIDVSLVKIDGAAQIAVRDHGVGIPADRRAGIFQRFYRAHTGTPYDYGGTGLGLYVARTIVEMHDGSIGFESEEGHGSTFWIRLPGSRARARPA